jgi:hypothetical protein
MAGAELVGDVAVILRALVGVADLQRDGRAGGDALEDAGEDFDLIRLAPLGDVARGAGAALVEPGLDRLRRERHARRAAIDHRAEGRAVALAPGRDAEDMAETVMRHGRAPSRR